ncbi:SETD7 [Lepeophtheirus salmonis]|uniref:SETD7 n=1 Tax=Lepeophtheirus salmonis TaxID=72036 RepID=A0A7R8CSE3_LEPSM|nr:SETD7 [Lepeophtheirus salmonis]CAF2916311.1 SETD7 [Lepeophtheirus salmonis]
MGILIKIKPFRDNPEDILSNWFMDVSNKSLDLYPTLIKSSIVEERPLNRLSFLKECSEDIFFTLNKEKLSLKDLRGSYAIYPSVGSICRKDLNIHRIKGYFENGLLQGLSEIDQRFRCKLGNCEAFSSKKKEFPEYLDEIVQYSYGQKVGSGWKFKIGGGALFGKLDPRTGNITDLNAVYIYPDNKTGLMGSFVNDRMISARPVKLIGFKKESCNLLLPSVVPLFDYDDGLAMTYEPANLTHIHSPLLRDPFEDQYIDVGSIVGFYQGVKASKLEAYKNKELRKSSYKVDNDWAHPNEILDIPQFYQSLKNYNATLCHLINHSPYPNTVFEEIDHPRFGKIRSIRVIKPLRPYEELSIDYGYIQDYFRVQDSYKSILELGKMFSETDNENDYYKDLKKHINYLKTKIEEYEPYVDMLKSVGGLIQSALK